MCAIDRLVRRYGLCSTADFSAVKFLRSTKLYPDFCAQGVGGGVVGISNYRVSQRSTKE